jgi:hypothetical protein
MKTNQEIQEICNYSESYCPIDKDGNLQNEVNDQTMYIVDTEADEQEKHHLQSKNQIMCIYDRDGENYYSITINHWW